jgi:hypothetical protein
VGDGAVAAQLALAVVTILPRAAMGEMMFPLVRDLADDGTPVTVTCRVLKLCRPQRWRY